ncbi:MAG: PilN domain-containing protein [Planctomycetota bacterium]|nr:MAG: PilN domain-containing protein [Planctomycetota bacterium]
MININFVPDDYVQNTESRRANLMYLVLFGIVMAALGGSFMTIKIRQRALVAEEKRVSARMAEAEESMRQFDELQARRKVMIKTALTTAELLEPVPRSVLLASLTNNLPPGVSLLGLELVQKQPKQTRRSAPANKYRATQAKNAAGDLSTASQEKLLETYIDIEGIAPSDLQVASYIEQLCASTLLDNVTLVESKEYKDRRPSKMQARGFGAPDSAYRQFKLTAMLRKDVHLTDEEVDKIKTKCEMAARNF